MAKYSIRTPFAIHLVHTSTVTDHDGKKRLVRKEESFFHGEGPVELTDADALAHIHKLEPADDASRKLFQDYHDRQDAARAERQAQSAGGPSLAAQVSEAVVGSLIAAGVIRVKAT